MRPKVIEIYKITDETGKVLFEGDFDAIKKHLYGLSRRTVENYIARGYIDRYRSIKLARCEGPNVVKADKSYAQVKAASKFPKELLDEWEEVCSMFRNIKKGEA